MLMLMLADDGYIIFNVVKSDNRIIFKFLGWLVFWIFSEKITCHENGSNFQTKKARRLGLVPKFAHRGGLQVTANEFYSKKFINIFKSCLKLKNRCGFWHALFLTIFNSNLKFCFWFFSNFLCFVIQNIIWLYTAEEKIRHCFGQFSWNGLCCWSLKFFISAENVLCSRRRFLRFQVT